jgi:tRNA(Ile)-lysidine synthase
MERADEPIGDDEFAGLFRDLARYDLVVLAVSGGADSMALMHLVARWRDRRTGAAPEIVVATVDHGLRAGSAEEARFVARAAADAGFPHEILAWQDAKPVRAVQETAREARYRLLADMASRAGATPAVVTAHHRDDQAETLLMRLARGSGLDGLSAMAPSVPIGRGSRVMLLRPLLGMPKQRLVGTLRSRGLSWIEDPSNEATAFERVRLRRARAALAELGLENEHIARSAARLRRARRALQAAAGELLAATADLHDGAYASLDRPRFEAAAEELRLRVLACLVEVSGGSAPPARLSELEDLLERISARDTRGITLGGCIVAARARAVCIFREPGREGIASRHLQPGEEGEWDGRFRVSLSRRFGSAVEVRALGAAAATLRAGSGPVREMPARAAQTLPSFWHNRELLAVPRFAAFESSFAGPVVDGEAVCRAVPLYGSIDALSTEIG